MRCFLRLVLLACVWIGLIAPWVGPELHADDGASSGIELHVAPSDRACSHDTDCTIAFTRCDSCDCGVGINKVHAAKYQRAYEKLCQDYRGAHCDRVCPIHRLVCRQQRCEVEMLVE